MANKRRGLLARIEADLLDDRVPLSSLLQRCIVLSGQAGEQELRDWARWELNGYADVGTVPDYRHVHSPVMAVVTNNAGYNPITQRVRDEVFGPQIRDIIREVVGDIEDAIIPFGTGMLEELANQGTEMHRISPTFSDVMADTLNQFNTAPNSRVVQLYWSVSNASIRGIVVRVRAALTDRVAELIRLTAPDQDVPGKQAAAQTIQLDEQAAAQTIQLDQQATAHPTQFTIEHAIIQFGDSRAGVTVTHFSGSQYNISDTAGNVAAGSSDFTQNYSAGFDVTKVREFADLVTQVGGLLDLDTGRHTELSAANTELHEAIDAPEADKGRIRRAWDAVMGIIKLGTNKAVTTAAINIGNQAANDLGAAIHHLHP
jgi:hypothetical protein